MEIYLMFKYGTTFDSQSLMKKDHIYFTVDSFRPLFLGL